MPSTKLLKTPSCEDRPNAIQDEDAERMRWTIYTEFPIPYVELPSRAGV